MGKRVYRAKKKGSNEESAHAKRKPQPKLQRREPMALGEQDSREGSRRDLKRLAEAPTVRR